MNILVINGSPKGENSITLQTVKYLSILNPAHEFRILHAGQKIKSLEKDFSPALADIKWANLLLFSYPVYTFIAPCQLHRFIELMKQHGADVSGRYATQITTSKHFYDTTAHRYVQDNCQDMGMKCLRGLSADMDDLLSEKGRREAEAFFDRILFEMANGYAEQDMNLRAAPVRKPVTPAVPAKGDKTGDVVIVADIEQGDEQLESMIARFRAQLPLSTRVVNLREYPFKGGCLGCFNCASDGKCIYQDGFDAFLRGEIQTAQAIVYAFTIRDHCMGARFKLYDDRQFCNGHRTVTMGMPMGYLISGNLAQEENLRTIIEGRAQVGGNPLAGIATDEVQPDTDIDRLALTLAYMLETRYVQPQMFLGVGGMKIFRDLIYMMQGMMRADHKFFKAHGQYDFPQKKKGTILAMYLVGLLNSNPKLKAKMGSKMTEGMLMPYKKLFKELEKKG